MSSKKIQLVEIPESKNLNKQIFGGTLMVLTPIIIIWYKEEFGQLDFSTFPGHWMELAFLTGGFILFLSAYLTKRKEKKHFVQFADHTLTYRNKGQEQVWIDKSDILKIESGEVSAILFLIDGEKKILKFGEAPDDCKMEIKEKLKTYLSNAN